MYHQIAEELKKSENDTHEYRYHLMKRSKEIIILKQLNFLLERFSVRNSLNKRVINLGIAYSVLYSNITIQIARKKLMKFSQFH